MTLPFFSFAFSAMASRCEVRLFAPDEDTARHWSDAAIEEVRRILLLQANESCARYGVACVKPVKKEESTGAESTAQVQ